MEKSTKKKIRVNSIKDSQLTRILKPCEARAGHGAILAVLIPSMGIAAIYFIIKLIKWLFGLFSN